jgi:hypothetical protein
MRAWRFRILANVDVRLRDVAELIDVIAEHGGDMGRVLGEDGVLAGRRSESGFAAGDGRFADQVFALVEIGFLLGEAHDDLRRPGHTVPIPITLRGWRSGCSRDRRGRFHFRATDEKRQGGESEKRSD